MTARRSRGSSWSRIRALRTGLIGAIILRDEWTCAYCARVVDRVDIEIDHVVTRKHGGGNDASNLVLACGPCNRRRCAGPVPDEARAEIERRLALPVDRVAGQVLGDELYPWAPARRAADSAMAQLRVARRARLLEGDAFPFGCAS